MTRSRFKTFRILTLSLILLFVALYSYEQRRASTSWYKTLEIVIYPINVEGSSEVANYIAQLKDEDFNAIDQFMAKQASNYELLLSKPIKTRLGESIDSLPPFPADLGKDILKNMIWSIQFRYWAWKNTPDNESNLRRVRMFVLYHQPVKNKRLNHSYGLNKGLIAYVNAFASQAQQGQNNVVITHEFLHTVGALDKYDSNNQPIYPQGYVEPMKIPRYPQKQAEIMAGRTPLSSSKSRMPKSLRHCQIGTQTAREINWRKD